MDDQISSLILEELRGLRTEVNDGFSETKQRLAVVETQIVPFFETDGGRDKIQAEIAELRDHKWYSLGFIGAITLVGHYIAHKVFHI